MGKYLPLDLKVAFFGCLGALLACGAMVLADTPSTSLYNGSCCRPNARNWGYYETQWRQWPCDQRPERVFPGSVGTEVVPAPAGQKPKPLPKAAPVTTKPETPTPGATPETPGPTPETPSQPGEPSLPGEGMQLPGEGMRLPGEEKPAEGPAPKPAEKPAESPRPPVPAPVPAPKQPAPEGSLPGLQPESPVPPAAKENPTSLPPSGNKEQVPSGNKEQAPAPSPPAPARQGDNPPANLDLPEVPKAPLPPDHSMIPYQQSQVVQTGAIEPVENGGLAMASRADWLAPQPAQDDPRCSVPAGSPVTGLSMETPVALDGYCPVALTEEEKWVRGDPRWSVLYAGRTFLFSGPEQKQRFTAAAARYLPGFAGDDAVLAVEGGAHVPGKPEHSLFCGGKVYLFANAETLARFQQNPGRYVAPGR
jgi:YHS domain-containing protein